MDRKALILLPLLLGGCSLTPHPITGTLPCSVGPIILNQADQLSDSTGRQIVALDSTGAAICGWKKPGAK
jgi:hypothetical protein